MSRENRRDRAPAEPVAHSAAPAVAADAGRRQWTVSWRHCFLGLVVGEALLLLLSNAGLDAANAVFGDPGRIDGGIAGVATLLAVMAGGYLAARLAGRMGMYQGIAVACGFILVAAVYQFVGEAQIVHASVTSGTHRLIDLGPMNLGDLMSNDLLALFAGSVGGLLSGKR